ncbi:PD-(D/E)XK motif protein [Brevundimonas sp. NPDC046655]|uniref:PD-(D/E)XK motif protein n=1 Tax=unclassified Brevundimonas TaxID=2622653 RepID=UPI00384C4D19
MDTTTLPPWEDIQRDYIDTGLPHRLVLRSVPGVHAFTDLGAARLGARFEIPASAAQALPSALEQITLSDVSVDGRRHLEVATTSPALFESFYRLIGQVSEAVLKGGSPQAALSESVALWESLLERTAVLSEERQAGLFGELLFLERLIGASVPDAVATWVGPDRQAHDFRRGDDEFEVKTTGGQLRIHRINGQGQLNPSVGCRLFLVSMQTGDAGSGGRTLPDVVDDLRAAIGCEHRQSFEARLHASGFVERHRAHYGRRRRLRSEITLIPVVDGVPRLVPGALAALPARFAPERIGKVVYDIDVTGLGHIDGSPEFLAVVPPVQDASS